MGSSEATRSHKPASTYVISITPFDRERRLDEEAFRGHLRRMADAGIGVYVGGGGSGEGFTLSVEEHRRVLEIAVEELKGKVPVRAMGVEPRMAEQMIDYVGLAKAAGVDATQIYSLDQGHGHQPTAREIEAYFADILDAIDLPSVISTHQSVGYRIPVDTMAALVSRYPHVIGVNFSHGDLRYLADLIDAVGDRVEFHVGGPFNALSALALGANGYLSSEGNLAPRLCVSVIRHFEQGNLAGMMDAFARVVRLSGALYGNGGIRATKAVLNHLGLPGGFPRRPQLEVAADVVTSLTHVVKELDLGAIEGW